MKSRISAFTILVPVVILLVVVGVSFFRARAQDARHKQLKLVQTMLEPQLIPGLELHPNAISMKEFDMLTTLGRNGVPRVLYLNKRAELRFFHDRATATKCFDCTPEITPYSVEVLDAVEASWESRSPTAIRSGDANVYDAIIPLVSKERCIGMVLLRASDTVLKSLSEVLISASAPSNQKRELNEEPGLSAVQYRQQFEALLVAHREVRQIKR